jgi:hypothetical protein
VIRTAACISDEPLKSAPVELRCQRRRQLVGDEYARSLALSEHVPEAPVARREIHSEPPYHIREVPFALSQVGILDRVEDRAEMIEHLL